MEERIFNAYFIEGKNIDAIPTLIELAKEIGLNASEAKNIFETAKYTDEVNQDLAEAKQIGITSVPKYIFNSNTKVSGAQDSNVYLEILEKEFAQWKSDNVKSAPEIIEGQFCKIGEDCK